MRLLLISIAAAFVSVTTAQSETGPRVDQITAAWEAWATKNGIKETAITIGRDGDILASRGRGRDPEAAQPIASLSKAITAVCLKRVADEQGLSLDTPLKDLSAAFAAVNIDIPPNLQERTLTSLITMTSGLKPDRTQSQFNNSYRYGDTRNIGFSKRALATSGLKGNAGEFHYNNGNYALLGALLEGLTGTDNVTACRDRVFPKGFRDTAGFDPDWIALAAFGGWQASTRDYTAFVMDVFGPKGDIASNLLKLPRYSDARGWYYGLGTHYRSRHPQNVYWHNGALCGTTGAELGSYFAYYPNGYAVTVSYDRCGRGDIFIDLDNALYQAANG
ncbi:MAG: serine hydrolase domain-containing protein [Pseudomonadota bacterium]